MLIEFQGPKTRPQTDGICMINFQHVTTFPFHSHGIYNFLIPKISISNSSKLFILPYYYKDMGTQCFIFFFCLQARIKKQSVSRMFERGIVLYRNVNNVLTDDIGALIQLFGESHGRYAYLLSCVAIQTFKVFIYSFPLLLKIGIKMAQPPQT